MSSNRHRWEPRPAAPAPEELTRRIVNAGVVVEAGDSVAAPPTDPAVGNSVCA